MLFFSYLRFLGFLLYGISSIMISFRDDALGSIISRFILKASEAIIVRNFSAGFFLNYGFIIFDCYYVNKTIIYAFKMKGEIIDPKAKCLNWKSKVGPPIQP